ncbi:S1 family peptidase [Kitasatospora sp. NPDC101801]|uniref:S1 family peptidase n=1 Tax=Kitasatospora sp. NPDC101801 TaxID=3364103 RepID=UPI0037F9B993
MTGNTARAVCTTGLLTALAAGLLAAPPAGALEGSAASTGTSAFTAKIDIGNGKRSCTGALVDPNWVITASSCFSDDPAQAATLRAGAPVLKTTAIIGRADLSTTAGQVTEITSLVPRADRDLVMARLATPVTDIAPLAVASAAPTAGEGLRVSGYGRTKTEWVPNQLHTASFNLAGVQATTLATAGATAGATVCKGDTGGPVVRETNGRTELVAVTSTSWQKGCIGSTETRDGTQSARTDDLAEWIEFVRSSTMPPAYPGVLRWFLSDSAQSNTSTRATFDYGNTPMVALAGDWDGDGRATAGAYDPASARFHFTNARTGGASSSSFQFGSVGDVPVVGKWDGGSTSLVGVYRPSNATFYLRHRDGSVTTFAFGNGGNWRPVAGDWTHKGFDTPGLYDPATSTFYLLNGNHSGAADITLQFGSAGDTPLAGDWNGSGTTQLGVFRPGNYSFYFRAANGSVSSVPYGGSAAQPVIGDWNGDGRATQGIVATG